MHHIIDIDLPPKRIILTVFMLLGVVYYSMVLFQAGDKIKVVSRVNDEWVNGELHGKTGMFPAEFVDSIPKDLKKAEELEQVEVRILAFFFSLFPSLFLSPFLPLLMLGNVCMQVLTGKCEALFDFEGMTEAGELSFVPGEIITTIEKVNKEWMKGRIGTREGIFPTSFVKVISEIPEGSAKKLKPKISSGAFPPPSGIGIVTIV